MMVFQLTLKSALDIRNSFFCTFEYAMRVLWYYFKEILFKKRKKKINLPQKYTFRFRLYSKNITFGLAIYLVASSRLFMEVCFRSFIFFKKQSFVGLNTLGHK